MATKNTNQSEQAGLKAARLVHPEDLIVGDFVAISEVSYQCATALWCGLDSFHFPPDELIELTYLATDDHFPQKVVSICLPFLLCEQVDSKHVIHDLRTLQLTRLDSGFAKAARDAYNADKELESVDAKSKKKKRKKQKKKKKNQD